MTQVDVIRVQENVKNILGGEVGNHSMPTYLGLLRKISVRWGKEDEADGDLLGNGRNFMEVVWEWRMFSIVAVLGNEKFDERLGLAC